MSKALTTTEIPALLELLKDRQDGDLHVMLQDQLGHLDTRTLQALWRRSLYGPDELAMEIGTILQTRNWEDLEATLARTPVHELRFETLLVMIARFGHPVVDEADIDQRLDVLANGCRDSLVGVDTDLARAAKIADYLGRELGFTGNQDVYYDPENSFIDSVLETRRGIPITLSAVYILVAERLGVPLRGIGLPGHFIVGLTDAENRSLYLDPFRKGMILTHLECVQLTEQLGHPFQDSFLRPVSPRYVFLRMLANLYHVYDRNGDLRRADRALTICHACNAMAL